MTGNNPLWLKALCPGPEALPCRPVAAQLASAPAQRPVPLNLSTSSSHSAFCFCFILFEE